MKYYYVCEYFQLIYFVDLEILCLLLYHLKNKLDQIPSNLFITALSPFLLSLSCKACKINTDNIGINIEVDLFKY